MATQQDTDSRILGTDSGPTQWFVLSRSIFCGGLAGVIAGVIFLGFGSRIFMRVLTLLNPETGGEITFGGTFAVVVFIGAFGGIFAGGIWIVIREHLPERLILRIPMAGVIATIVGSFPLVESSISASRAFDPVALNVAIFMILVGLTGSATAYGDWILQRRLPDRPNSGKYYSFMAVVGVIVGVPLIFLVFFGTDLPVQDPPRVAGGFFAVAMVGTVLSWTRYSRWRLPTPPKAGAWIGTIGLAGFLAFGGLHLLREWNEIL